jgi:hypothetical protein
MQGVNLCPSAFDVTHKGIEPPRHPVKALLGLMLRYVGVLE